MLYIFLCHTYSRTLFFGIYCFIIWCFYTDLFRGYQGMIDVVGAVNNKACALKSVTAAGWLMDAHCEEYE